MIEPHVPFPAFSCYTCTMKRLIFALTVTILLAGVWAYASHKPSIREFRTQKADFWLKAVASGLHHPWSIAFLPNESGYIVTERRGRLWHIARDGQKTEIKNVPQVYAEGQGGLLDILVPPDFKDGDWIYFTAAIPDPQTPDAAGTEAFRARLYVRQARLDKVESIFKQKPKVESDIHFGSRLVLAPDGTLFITAGERGDKEQAQNPENHMGTVVRINTDGTIPEDNPNKNDPKIPHEIYSYGHRNPQGMALRPGTDEIWEIEHGPQGGDEINILKRGANFGWPAATYGRNYVIGTKISEHTTLPGMEDPIWQWTPSIAPSGMAFYTGDRFPEWKGDLFVGALVYRHLERLEIEDRKIVRREILIQDFGKRIRDVRNGPDGYLYLLTDEDDGELLRLEPL